MTSPWVFAVLAWPIDCGILYALRAILRRAARLVRRAWDELADIAISGNHALNKAAVAILYPHLTAYALALRAVDSVRTAPPQTDPDAPCGALGSRRSAPEASDAPFPARGAPGGSQAASRAAHRREAAVTVPCDPNWRDNPDELDALCQRGARELHGPQAAGRDVTDIEPPQEYL